MRTYVDLGLALSRSNKDAVVELLQSGVIQIDVEHKIGRASCRERV